MPNFSLNRPIAPASTPGNWLTAGFSSGLHGALSQVGSTYQALGTLTGVDALTRGAQGFAQSQQAQEQAASQPYLNSNPGWLSKLGFQVAQMVPSIGGMIAAGALVPEEAVPAGLARLGAWAPKLLGGGALRAGADFAARRAALESGMGFARTVTGATVAGLPSTIGGNVQSAEQGNNGAPLSRTQAAESIALGVPEAVVGGLLPAEVRGGEGVAGGVARNIIKGAAVGAPTMGAVSGVQTGLSDLMNPNLTSAERAHNVINAALSGGLGGAVFGGVGGAFHRAAQDPNLVNASTDNLEAAVASAPGQPPVPAPIPPPEHMTPLSKATGNLYATTNNPDLIAMESTFPKGSAPHAIIQEEIARRTQPGLASGQGTLHTPEEMAIRQPQIDTLSKIISDATGVDQDKAKTLNAATEPELINALRSRVGPKAPDWIQSLAETYGLTKDTDPGKQSVVLQDRLASLTQARDIARDARNVPGMRAATSEMLEIVPKLEEANRLVNLRLQADDLLPKPEVPLPQAITDVTGQLNIPGLGEKPPEQPVLPVPGPVAAVSGDQLRLLTPQETGEAQQARLAAVQEFQQSLMATAKNRLVRAVIPSLDVANKPELVNVLRAHVADADENNGGSLDPGLRALASEYGVTDSSGAPRDLAVERSDLNADLQNLWTRASNEKAEGQKSLLVDDALKIQKGSLAQMDELIGLHEQADQSANGEVSLEVPDRVAPERAQQWTALQAIKDGADPDMVGVADNAQRAIEQHNPNAQGIAQLALNRFANSQRAKVVTEKTNAVREPSATGVDVQQPAENGGAVAEGHAEGNVAAQEAAPEQGGVKQTSEESEAQLRAISNLTPSEKRARTRAKLPVLPAPDLGALQTAHDSAVSGSGQQEFAANALKMADVAPSKNEQDRVVSNALQTLAADKVSKKPPLAKRAVVTSGDMDTALSHLVGMGATGKDVTEYLGMNAADSMVRMYAKFLHGLGVDPSIHFSETPNELQAANGYGDAVAGYDEVNHAVHLYSDTDLQSNILHELTHAATYKALSKATPMAREMQRLFQHVKGTSPGNDAYGLTNVHEFTAEAFSNPRFAEFLKSLPPETGSRAGNVWQALKNAVFKLLGMPARARSMFDQVMETGHGLMEENAHVGSVEDTTHQMMLAATEANTMLAKRSVAKDQIDRTLRSAGFGSETLAKKVAEKWTYFGTLQTIVNDFGHLFKSGGLKTLRTLKQHYTALGNQFAGLGNIPQSLVRSLTNSKSRDYTDLNDVMRLATTHEFNFLPWEQQPGLESRPDAAALKPIVDYVNSTLSRLQQRGFMPALREMIAHNEMTHLFGMTRMVRELRTPDFGKYGVIDRNDPFEEFRENNDVKQSNVLARDFAAQKLNDELADYKTVTNRFASELAALPEGDLQRKELQEKIDSLDSVTGYVDKQLAAMKQAPYFHMGRNGDFVVSTNLATDDDGKLDPKAVAALQDALVKNNYKDITVNGDIGNPKVFMRVDNPDDMAHLETIVRGLEKDGHVEGTKSGSLLSGEVRKAALSDVLDRYISGIVDSTNFENDPKGKIQEEVRDQLMRARLDMMPESRLVWQARENVQGASMDMMRMFAKRAQIGANALANMAMSRRINDAVGSMRADIEDAKGAGNPRQTLMMQTVMNELEMREANRVWRPMHTMWDTMRSFVHAWYLGVSPAYFALELSQMVIGAIPEMGKSHGYMQATTTVAKNLPMTIRVMRWIAAGGLGKYATPTKGNNQKFGVPDSIANFILHVSNSGNLETSSMTHALGQGATEGVQKRVDNFLHWANITALYTEVAMRVNVALASRDLHNSRPYAGGLDAFVEKNLNEGLQDFSPSNAPRAFGKQGVLGGATPMVFQFHRWQLQMVQKLYTEVHGLIGAARPGESAADTSARRIASGKFLAGHLGTVGVMSGALGLPIAQTLLGYGSNIANGLTGTEQFDFENDFRGYLTNMFGPEFGDAVAHGVPRLAGVDLSEFGDKGLVPFGEFFADQRKWQDAAQDWSWHAMGSSVSWLGNFLNAFDDFSHGDAIDGMKNVLPASLKGPFEAYEMGQHGYEDTKTGFQWNVQPTSTDVAEKALGLQPASLSQYEERRQESENILARRQNVLSFLHGNLVRSYMHGDQAGVRDAIGAEMDFARRNPGIIPQPVADMSNAVHQMTISQVTGMMPGTSLQDMLARQRLSYYYTGANQ